MILLHCFLSKKEISKGGLVYLGNLVEDYVATIGKSTCINELQDVFNKINLNYCINIASDLNGKIKVDVLVTKHLFGCHGKIETKPSLSIGIFCQ